MSLEDNNLENLSEKDQLKLRVLKVKTSLPNSYMAIFFELYPELNTAKGLNKLCNVVNLKQSDEDITRKLEAMVDKLKAE